jgi:hypothetical protein
VARVHENKAFWGTNLAGDLKVHRAGKNFSFADFEVRNLAEVSEEAGGYVCVFKHYFPKVRQSKCNRKRMFVPLQ